MIFQGGRDPLFPPLDPHMIHINIMNLGDFLILGEIILNTPCESSASRGTHTQYQTQKIKIVICCTFYIKEKAQCKSVPTYAVFIGKVFYVPKDGSFLARAFLE